MARVSFGPFIQRAALTGLAGLAGRLLAGDDLPGRHPGPQLSGRTAHRLPYVTGSVIDPSQRHDKYLQ